MNAKAQTEPGANPEPPASSVWPIREPHAPLANQSWGGPLGSTRRPQSIDGDKDLFGAGALPVGIGFVDPARLALGVHQNRRGEGDIGAVIAAAEVPDPQSVEQLAFRVREESEAGL